MANTFLKPEVIAGTALELLRRESVLPNLVWANATGDFAGAKGDTITIRVPATAKARKRALRATGAARNIIMDELVEDAIAVKLDTDIYSAVPVTDEELTLDITDFAVQVLQPQINAVVDQAENDIAASMAGATYATTVEVNPADPWDAIIEARKSLNDANVPRDGRALLVGSGLEAALLKSDQFVRYDQAGDQDAFREARIGRVAGTDVYTSNAIDEDEGYFFHRTAYIFASRAPQIPNGAAFGASQSASGLALRWLRDYDFTSTTDRSLVDVYTGHSVVKDHSVPGDAASPKTVQRSVKLTLDVTP